MPISERIDNIPLGVRNWEECHPDEKSPVGKINTLPEASFPHRSIIFTSSWMSLSLRLRS